MTSAADQHAIRHLVAAERLYVPARALPETRDAVPGTGVPRPFLPAPGTDTAAVAGAYAASAAASAGLTAALDVAAVMTGSPSQELAFVRAASRTPLGAENPATTGAADLAGGPAFRHSVERAVRRAGATEPLLLFRARMIDNAGRQLVAEAASTVPACGPGEGAVAGAAKSQEVATAAQSFPRPAGHTRTGQQSPASRPSDARTPAVDQPSLRKRA